MRYQTRPPGTATKLSPGSSRGFAQPVSCSVIHSNATSTLRVIARLPSMRGRPTLARRPNRVNVSDTASR